MMRANPKVITPALLSVVVMPNGEVICLGKTVGWVRAGGDGTASLGPHLTPQTDFK